MRDKRIDLDMTGYAELFMNDSERAEAKLPRIYDIRLEEIDDFPDHPFKVLMDEDMEQLVESIKERGVITPVIVRKKEDGRYEMVAGHRRKKACELAGLPTVRAEVREMSLDEAIILMVESNLQRSTILPSEKAFSYKMRLEAMKRQGKRTDLTSAPMATKLTGGRSNEELGELVGESKDQVCRYIRLTELIPSLLDQVDQNRVALRPAVELSYGSRSTEERIVAVALSQVGDVRGRKYWNWCGFSSRIPWYACFVTWCADQSGILSELRLPRYINVADWVNWSKQNGRWYDGSITPEPGMMVFYDWYEEDPNDPDGGMVQDGVAEHIGIVVKVENGKVYTVEGNVDDSCMACVRELGREEIMGYGKLM